MMDIPRYPERRPLRLDDKPLLNSTFADLQPRISELTFAGLYLFRQAHDYHISTVEDALVITGCGYDKAPYFLCPLTDQPAAAVHRLLAEGLMLYGAEDVFASRLLHDSDFEVFEDRDNFDYLYLRKELAELPGNRYHKKKNRINYFLARHACNVEPYEVRHYDSCMKLLDEWLRVHESHSSKSLSVELQANREALELAPQLGLEGLVALVEGEVKGLVLGERLNSGTSVCHFEKADPFLDGLYQLLDREFCRLLFTDCEYVNREQDLGEQNLRESKLSYHPFALVKKFRVHKVRQVADSSG